ncbi:MAG: serine hydrolase domain-containing protein, partial [Bacteroidota bacterium]
MEQKVDQADELVQGTLEEHHLPGISVTVLQAGEQIYSKGFGYADIAEERAINPSETRFRIGSFSKTLAASAMMRLVEAEKVHLDSSIYHYVPNYPKKKWDFTPRLVGGHLSGIRHYNGQEMLIDTYYTNVSDALSIFSADTLLHEPGFKYHYS